MNLEEKYSQLTKELIEPIATGHVLKILKEQEGLSATKFINKYLSDVDRVVDEQSFRRWTREGIQPRKEIIEQVKKIPNYQQVYNKAQQVIKEKYFEIEVGNEKIDVIDMLLKDEELKMTSKTLYEQNKAFLKYNKERFNILLRVAEYFKFLTNFESGEVDFYPLMVFLLDAQNNELNESELNEDVEVLISKLKKDIISKFTN